jgi:methionyl-tRNA formyltransferase
LNIAVCADKWVGYELLDFIFKTKKDPVKFVIAQQDSPYKDKIKTLCLENEVPCYTNIKCNTPEFKFLLQEENIDIGMLLWWPTILKKEIIESVNTGFINTHPSLIPLNRGKHPYYWATVSENPIGSTLHFINENVDEGNILFQEPYVTDISDTGDEIYEKSLNHMVYLFKKNYVNILEGSYTLKKPDLEAGDFHLSKEIEIHSCIDLNRSYIGKELLNIIRARTFKNSKSAYFIHNEKKYFVRLQIEEDQGQYD